MTKNSFLLLLGKAYQTGFPTSTTINALLCLHALAAKHSISSGTETAYPRAGPTDLVSWPGDRQRLLAGSPSSDRRPLKGTWHGSWPPNHDLAANSN